MAIEIILPRVDMDMSTGRILRWFIDEGASVEKGAPLFEIETDKAAMEIEAPGAGVLRLNMADLGGEIAVGSVIGWICKPGEKIEASPPAPGTVPSAGPASNAPVPSSGEELPARDGRIESALEFASEEGSTARLESPPRSDPALPTADAGTDSARTDSARMDSAGTDNSAAGNVAATPLARRLATRHGLALDSLTGSGPRQRIQARDVERAAQAASSGPEAATTPAAASDPVAKTASVPAAAPDRAGDRPAALHRAWLRSGEGRPIVLVHGFGAELASWRAFVPTLPAGRPVLALDLPGHGRSPGLPAPSLDALADALVDALVEEGVGQIDLVGHSLGAAVACRAADSGGLDIRSLTLLAPAGLGPDINGAFLDGLARARSEASLAPWLALLVADPRVLGRGFVRATARARADTALVEAQAALARALFPDGTQAISIVDALARLAVPTRLIVGTADRIIPPHHALSVPGHVAVHRLPGIGHMPHLEDPALVARILAEHVSG